MSTIVTRASKGSILTIAEMDSNLTNLNTDKLEADTSVTLTNKTINLSSNTLTGTAAQFNIAVSDADFITSGGDLGTPSSGILTNCTFPTLNQNTTGTAADLSATLVVGKGGTGLTSVGTSGNVLTSNGSVWVSQAPASSGFTLGTPVATTSGSAIDMTAIPSTATMVVINLKGISTNNAFPPGIQLGTSGGIETTGYVGSCWNSGTSSGQAAWGSNIALSSMSSWVSGDTYSGRVTLVKESASNNTWSITFNIGTAGVTLQAFGSGYKSLSGALNRVRLMGATFDAGEMNIAYM